jgi:hypothetical protein
MIVGVINGLYELRYSVAHLKMDRDVGVTVL